MDCNETHLPELRLNLGGWNGLSNRWKRYFSSILLATKGMSKDKQTKVGSLLIDTDKKQVVSSGYNGLPRNVMDKEERLTRPHKYSYTIHSELNCILTAMKNNCCVDGLTMLCTLAPCCHCTAVIVQSGIKQLVCPPFDMNHVSCGDGYKASLEMLKEADIDVIILDERELEETNEV